MKYLTLIASVLALTASPVSGQVQNLVLSEINHIETPTKFTQVYTADLQGNSVKEFIVRDSNYVYVFDSQTDNIIWASPWMLNPQDVKFYDFDRDGHLDLAVRDSLNLFVYSGADFRLLWSSPPLDGTYSCYSLGDRNSDGNTDVVLVKKAGHNGNYDSILVKIYNGPDYQQPEVATALLSYYSEWEGPVWWTVHESPLKVVMGRLSSGDGIQNRIILFSTISSWGHSQPPSDWTASDGLAYMIEGDSSRPMSAGQIYSLHLEGQGNDTSLYAISQYREDSFGNPPMNYHYRVIYFTGYNADSLFLRNVIWASTNNEGSWGGFLVGEINGDSTGDEICYSANNSLLLRSFPGFSPIWTVDSSISLFKLYHNNGFFQCPQIMSTRPYSLFQGTDGSLSATINDEGIILNDIIDLDNDGTDELLSYADNDIYIYHAEIAPNGTMDNSPGTPSRFCLYANYPNPFNPTTTIKYDLPKSSDVTIDIFDILGRKIETLVSGKQSVGSHSATWYAGDATSGVYFYRIKAGDYCDTRKCLLLK
jgi:hypothetical protein